MADQRIHKPLLLAVETGLKAILEEGQPTDKFLLTIGRKRQFGSRDRKFIAGHIYDIIRYRRLLETIYAEVPSTKINRYQTYVILNILRRGDGIANATDILADDAELIEQWKKLFATPSYDDKNLMSFPDWMWELGESEYGEAWKDIANSLNESPVTYIRVNTLKTTANKLQQELHKLEIECRQVEGTDALELITKRKLSNHPLYLKGNFEFQDLASQHVALLSEIGNNMIVVESCAGAGGKSLHLAALMKNTGLLLASDKIPKRLKQLQYRARRNGVTNLEIVDYGLLNEWNDKADRVVLDVPCTATGTIWRKPEIKWNVSVGDLNHCTGIQATILSEGAQLVKPGGKLVYATCSIFKSEGEAIVAGFLKDRDNFQLELERRFWPSTDRSDGFYVAVLSRQIDLSNSVKI